VKVSVIICTLNRVDDLRKTLESIDDQVVHPDELLLVDQSDNQETKKLAQEKRPYPVRYIPQKEKSLTTARNRGIRHAKGDIYVFLDDDVTLDRDYLVNLIHSFESTNVAAVHGYITNYFHGPKLLFILNKYYNWVFANDFLSLFACRVRGIFGNTYPLFMPVNELQCSTMSGCNFSLRASFIKKKKIQFDEQLIRYSFKEDADVGHRIWQAGGTILLNPEMLLVHHASTAGRITPIQQLRMRYAYFSYLFFKNVSQNMLYYAWSLYGELLKRTLTYLVTFNLQELKHTYEAIHFTLHRLEKIRALDLKEVNEAIFA